MSDILNKSLKLTDGIDDMEVCFKKDMVTFYFFSDEIEESLTIQLGELAVSRLINGLSRWLNTEKRS